MRSSISSSSFALRIQQMNQSDCNNSTIQYTYIEIVRKGCASRRISTTMLQAFAISLTVLSVTLGVIPIITGVRSSSDCELIGKGGCRGPNWSFEDWPKNIGKKEDCCSGCRETKGCTSYHMTKNKECVLYGHKEIIPAQSLAGNCFRLREHNEESGSHRTHGDEFISSKQCEQMVEKRVQREVY
ncbi:unnamed protein product [Lepeophtheirus salmonis]|uniref:(salmon louse) hypothetical protein n=1 Tax=Lepeophtheirus salmonis TaxID=72036 RepID=A0A7R8D1I5_LEPSM|nr:unnamed protein product [Lepeophtheirus salmonis]CAF2969529.1 unnamed protein product [Lepeophtheirus salmonis]